MIRCRILFTNKKPFVQTPLTRLVSVHDPAMAPRKPRAPKAAVLPPQLPAGLEMTDLFRHGWRLGDTIGSGGFGQIYSASPVSGGSGGSQYVIKVEAHDSGPLFSEMHCYLRVARAENIAAWQREKGLRRFGMPRFVGSGSFDYGGGKYRFMVIDRFGTDLQKLLEQNNNRFPMPTILHIGLQVIDVLEFIHSQEYIHGDIKAQNLLLGLGKDTKDLVYLVDFGLACRYASDGVHREYKLDIRKAHNGTIEFTSRDAHIGAQSRRSDLEILGYNLLQWASGTLPWMDRLENANQVAKEKNRLMDDVPAMMRACFPDGLPKGADAIQRFLSAVAALKFEREPDYAAFRAILQAGLRSLGNPPVRLVFTQAKDVSSPRSSGRRRERSPLQAVQESAVPSRRAAAKKPARGRTARAARAVQNGGEDDEEEEVRDEPAPLQNGAARQRGRAAARKRPSPDSGEEDGAAPVAGRATDGDKRPRAGRKAAAAKPSSATNSTTSSSSIYDNVNPAMQEVLDLRARGKTAAAAKRKPATAKLMPKPAAATSRALGKGRAAAAARRAASPAARWALSDDDGEGESFHTPPSTVGLRRSGRLSGGGSGAVSRLAQPRRSIRGDDCSPELW